MFIFRLCTKCGAKILIDAQIMAKNRNFGPLNVIESPKMHILDRNRAYICPLVRPVHKMKESKKKKERQGKKLTGKLGVRPDHPRWYVLHSGWSSGGSSIKFCRNRLNGLRDMRG